MSVKITVQGIEYPSIYALADKFGINRKTLLTRIYRKWTPEEAVGLVPHLKFGSTIEIDGIKYNSTKAACEAFNICYGSFYNRRCHGWTIKQALELEPSPKEKPTDLSFKIHTNSVLHQTAT